MDQYIYGDEHTLALIAGYRSASVRDRLLNAFIEGGRPGLTREFARIHKEEEEGERIRANLRARPWEGRFMGQCTR